MAEGRNEHFRVGAVLDKALDRALELARIQQISASAAKDYQAVRESMQKSFTNNNQ